MRRLGHVSAFVLGSVLLGSAGMAHASSESPSRAQALAALDNRADAEARRLGARWLAEAGTLVDLPALARALHDTDTVVRTLAEQAMWQVWSKSGDADVDQLFTIGIDQMNARQLDMAAETFTRIVEKRPEFAEGWNKRATAYYLLGEYSKSLADCDEVMKRNRYHFGALAGYGMIYLQLDQPALALAYFEKALAVNPNLQQVRETADALRQILIRRGRETI